MSKPRIVDKLRGKITDRLYDVKVERVADEDEITVIGVNQEFPRDILSLTPQEFAGICREYLKEKTKSGEHNYRAKNDRDFLNNYKTAWFSNGDLKFLAKKLDISEVAFFNVNRNHWNLILSASKTIFTTYDPTLTQTKYQARKISTPDVSVYGLVLTDDLEEEYFREAERMPKTIKRISETVTIRSPNYTQKDFLIKHKYKISDDFIDKIGVVQHDAYNRGPYCLYAAKMSNEGIVFLDDENELEFY